MAEKESRKEAPSKVPRAFREEMKDEYDMAFKDNGIKVTLGTPGEFQGHPYDAAVKVRGQATFNAETKQHTIKLSYSSMRRFIAWIQQEPQKSIFNAQLKAEIEKNTGIDQL